MSQAPWLGRFEPNWPKLIEFDPRLVKFAGSRFTWPHRSSSPDTGRTRPGIRRFRRTSGRNLKKKPTWQGWGQIQRAGLSPCAGVFGSFTWPPPGPIHGGSPNASPDAPVEVLCAPAEAVHGHDHVVGAQGRGRTSRVVGTHSAGADADDVEGRAQLGEDDVQAQRPILATGAATPTRAPAGNGKG